MENISERKIPITEREREALLIVADFLDRQLVGKRQESDVFIDGWGQWYITCDDVAEQLRGVVKQSHSNG